MDKKVKVRMRDSAPLQEYHGDVDVIAGEEFELEFDKAVKLVRRMPDSFEPVDFEIPKLDQTITSEGKTIRLRLKYNPYIEEYHSQYADLAGPGDEADFPQKEAERLLSVMPKSVFQIVEDRPFQENQDADDSSNAENKDSLSPAEVENKQIDGQILSLIAEESKSFDEIKRMLGNLDLDKIRMRVMSLARMGKIKKDDEDRWASQE